MSRRQLVNILEDAQRIGNVSKCEVRIQRFEIDFALYAGVLEDRLDLRTEHQRLSGRDCVIERLLSNAIASDVKFALLVVPNRKRKHSAQVIRARWAILFVSMNDRFGVGVGLEHVTAFLELVSKFVEAVDLSVEDDGDGAVFT